MEKLENVSVSSSSQSSRSNSSPHMTLEELRAINKYAESTKSLSYLPQVHERQRARMRTRSEWFLQPAASLDAARSRPGTPAACSVAARPRPAPHAPCAAEARESTALYVLVACLEFLF
ncbi:unnamed protein product [Arctia plantaginis]|uniref:Uncharacterized protein n=1 Tax=Arctia plantaginis TaxID=874455 RepID=A0A8S1A292_ARCPL|nr:unnamed protein product [Arctia plantaginis]CAB3238500.1 unnamed protein product [Arctia plantaginis]